LKQATNPSTLRGDQSPHDKKVQFHHSATLWACQWINVTHLAIGLIERRLKDTFPEILSACLEAPADKSKNLRVARGSTACIAKGYITPSIALCNTAKSRGAFLRIPNH